MEIKLRRQKEETERLRQEAFESQLREQVAQAQTQAQIEKMAPQEAIAAAQVEALTARLEVLHSAQLLSDEELFGLEDFVADFLEARADVDVVTMETVNTIRAVGKMPVSYTHLTLPTICSV